MNQPDPPPPLERKAVNIKRGALAQSEGDLNEAVNRLAMIAAMLTDPSKPLRDHAKERLRELQKKAGP